MMEHRPADRAVHLPERFTDLVRDALLHLYDPAQLQTHALLTAARNGTAEPPASGGRVLRQALLDAIEALQPGHGVAAASRAWRAYRILELRYLEALDVADVIGRVALSKSQYHREHQRALHAVAAVLWERWSLADRWHHLPPARPAADGLARSAADGLARSEAERLRSGAATRIDPLEVLRSAARVVEPLCAARGIALHLTMPERSSTVSGDRVALRQALLTILGHAAATIEAGPLAVAVRAEPDRITLTVSGPDAPGLGPARLGIVESEPFVEALGGTAEFRPAEPPTCRWSVALTFPAEEPPLLLVVDNNDDFRRLVERFLAGHPWTVVGAASVDEAFALARDSHPVAILLDVVIPGRDGWELLLELKQLPATRDIPVVVCSVLDEPAVAISLGAAAYLQKPIDQDRLLAVLAQASPPRPPAPARRRGAPHPPAPATARGNVGRGTRGLRAGAS